jgi:predicted DNA-binding transcriptional regulator AlpA
MTMEPKPISELMTEKECAEFLRLSTHNLRARRSNKQGPPYKKIGGAVRYDTAEVRAWVDSHSVAVGR